MKMKFDTVKLALKHHRWQTLIFFVVTFCIAVLFFVYAHVEHEEWDSARKENYNNQAQLVAENLKKVLSVQHTNLRTLSLVGCNSDRSFSKETLSEAWSLWPKATENKPHKMVWFRACRSVTECDDVLAEIRISYGEHIKIFPPINSTSFVEQEAYILSAVALEDDYSDLGLQANAVPGTAGVFAQGRVGGDIFHLPRRVSAKGYAGIPMLMPVYSMDSAARLCLPDSIEMRRKRLLGFVSVVFGLDELNLERHLPVDFSTEKFRFSDFYVLDPCPDAETEWCIFGHYRMDSSGNWRKETTQLQIDDGNVIQSGSVRWAGHVPSDAEQVEHVIETFGMSFRVIGITDDSTAIAPVSDSLYLYLVSLAIILAVIWFVASRVTSYRLFSSVSRLKETEESLQESVVKLQKEREAAQLAERVATDVLSRASHELRSPLHAIITSCDFLRSDLPSSVMSTKAEEDIQTVVQSSQYVLTLVNDILDYAQVKRSDSSKLRFVKEEMQMNETLEQARTITSPLFEREDSVNIVVKNVDRIVCDPILVNLLGNAAKFSEGNAKVVIVASRVTKTNKGAVKLEKSIPVKDKRHVKTLLKPHKSYEGFLISIADNGPGISRKDLNKIFGEFEGGSAKKEGSGLGLTIARTICRGFSGDLWARSVKRKGATFWVLMSCQFIERPPSTVAISRSNASHHSDGSDGPPGSSSSPSSRSRGSTDSALPSSLESKFLVCDDSRINRTILMRILNGNGLENVILAENGAEAVKQARATKFDFVLMDLHLGQNMTGVEAAKRIRQGSLSSGAVIVATTADVFFTLDSEGGDFFDSVLYKPFTSSALMRALKTKNAGV